MRLPMFQRLPLLLTCGVFSGLTLPSLAFAAVEHPTPAPQTTVVASHPDSDRDGLSDELEQALLDQFTPTLHIGRDDCSAEPAVFRPGDPIPTVTAENGTLYGQVNLGPGSTAAAPLVELHYFHLWRVDCGAHGHALDTEHVAVLVRPSGPDLAAATWTALFWYAAAHENTVCDVSQIARASTLHAVDHGAQVWISPGKHASYLAAALCHQGCGADRCERMVTLPHARVINLGEVAHPMNGSAFIASPQWPLQAKMQATNFPSAALARLNALPPTEVAWFNPGRHPAQGVIAVSSTTGDAIAVGGTSTRNAVATGGNSTADALSVSEIDTGNALDKSYRKTLHALGRSAHNVGKALHATTPDGERQTPPPQ